MVPLTDHTDPAASKPPISRDAFRKALYFMGAKRRCQGFALSCFFDELPWELIPRQARQRNATFSPQAGLIVNSSFRYARRGEAPPEIGERVPPMDGLLRGVPLAWIEDSGTGMWTPFWARGEWIEILATLRPGEPAPDSLSPHVRRTLAIANVLVAPGGEENRRETWEQICQDAGEQFRRLGYTIVRDLIHPFHIGALRQYYRALVASDRLPRGDEQVAERYRLHSEPVAMFLHPQLARLVSRIAGEAVKPSYIYFASYPSGADLPRHVDREQCEFSISLLVDYIPDPDGPAGWPLFLEHPSLPNGVAAADLGVGDALFYRGRQLAHYRDPLAAGHRSSSIFLHYVRESFDGDTL